MDWNLVIDPAQVTDVVTPHVGVWIETTGSLGDYLGLPSHTSCRCVDWNFACSENDCHEYVTPHVGVWIETQGNDFDLNLETMSHLM